MIRLLGVFFLGLSLIGGGISTHAEEETKSTLNFAEDASSAILIERDTGEVLFEKNSQEKLPPASMTKVMTMLLIMEAIDSGKISWDDPVRTSERAASMGGSQIFLEPGEEMTVEENNGFSTIEVYENNNPVDDLIWSNGKD